MTILDTSGGQDVTMIGMPHLLVAPACPVAAWRLTEDSLVMEGEGATRLLGRWDRQFGCWEWRGNRLAVLMPDTPVLDRRGVWLEPPVKWDDHWPRERSDSWPRERSASWYESRSALAGYFGLIPTPIRRLVAPYGTRQWALLDAIWRDPRVARELDNTQA